MVEFLFTEDNNFVDSDEQPSECIYDLSTSNMLITSLCIYYFQ